MSQVVEAGNGEVPSRSLRTPQNLRDRNLDGDDAPGDRGPTPHVGIAILGAGFAGLGMAIRLKQNGFDDFCVLERESHVGGTWYVNTYPGCACDVPSHLYSFSFAPNPNWTRAYSPQPEIKAYLHYCAQRFGILPHIRFNTTLLSSTWSDEEQRWHLLTSAGSLTANVLILGQGPLTEVSWPNIPGIERFEGALFHSARWKHDYDLTGKRVAVIGTGASAIQVTPAIQPTVSHLLLFQRTPAWIMPRGDHEIPGWQRAVYQKIPVAQRLMRSLIYAGHEARVLGFAYWPAILSAAERVAKRHLASQVQDPVLRAKLTPTYRMGCKRVLVSDDFYPALTQPNVSVVTDGIVEIRAHSIVTADGREHEVDAIVCGTGFHVADSQLPQSVLGSNSRSLGDEWEAGPQAYLGTTVAGYPNLFMLTGPNTGTGHNSQVYMIESQIAYVLDCIQMMSKKRVRAVDVKPESQAAFNAYAQRRMRGTVWVSGCSSWYLDKSGRNTTLWPAFTFLFRAKTRRFDPQHYTLTRQEAPATLRTLT